VNRRTPKNPHLKTLEQALAARFGWQPGALRDAIVAAVVSKADRLGLDEVTYCRMASASSGELQAFAELVAPGDSRFFRDASQFEALRERVLPELVAARSTVRKLRLLSAGTNSFKYDLGSEDRGGNQDSEVSVFVQDHGKVRHFYSSHPRMSPEIKERGLDLLNPIWNVLDLTPHGRGDFYASLAYGTNVRW